MKPSRSERVIRNTLEPLDIDINGDRPWDIQVHKPEFYSRVLASGSLALGETYMDGWWDCRALDQFFERILSHQLDRKIRSAGLTLFATARDFLFNMQSKARAFIIGERHYDTGNDLFRLMLDKGLNYSCGYWDDAETLDQAQEAKLDLICRKLGIEPGMTVLDIGCGWGGLARYAAKHYGAAVTGVTVSKEQACYACDACRDLDVTIEIKDYRDLDQTFDRVVSVGMFEHVGWRNYRTFMTVVRRCLKPSGIFLLHTIAGNQSTTGTDPWINRYIFPNSMVPSAKQICRAAEGLFLLEDWHSFGPDYDRTLMAWYRNFTRNWEQIQERYDQRFFRMWTYYLLSCAASFRTRRNQLWQIVFSSTGLNSVYRRQAKFFV